MILTVKEVADQYNVTKSTIYKKISQSMRKELEPFIVKKAGVTHILPEGVELIGGTIQQEVENEKNEATTEPDIKALIDRLERLESEYIATLKEQLQEKDRQIERSQILQQQNLNRIAELEGAVKDQKQRWWQKLKWWE